MQGVAQKASTFHTQLEDFCSVPLVELPCRTLRMGEGVLHGLNNQLG